MNLRGILCVAVGGVFAAGCCRGTAGPAASVRETHVVVTGDAGPDLVALARVLRPTVVNIVATEAVQVSEPGHVATESPRRLLTFRHELHGAGFFLDARHVVTSAHLVADASTVRVQLADERELPAKIIGQDPALDVAVLSVAAPPDVTVASLGSSAALEVGEPVIAIGNPLGFGHSVTAGIVSAKGRVLEDVLDDLIQTDTPINPGNSGGPLFNRRGEVVGMTSSIATPATGVAFAIPIDALREVIPELIAHGHVARGQLGVDLQALDEALVDVLRLPSPSGAIVAAVDPEGPSARAGLRRGDVIVGFEGGRVRSARELERSIARRAPGSRVVLAALRDGKDLDVSAVLSEREGEEIPARPPAPTPAGWGIDLIDDDRGEVRVRDVLSGSVLDGRLERGDHIVEVDRAPVTTARDAEERWSTPGPHLLWIERDGSPRYVGLTR